MVGRSAGGRAAAAHGTVNDLLVARVVVDVDGDAAERRHLGREVVQARVVLSVCREVRGRQRVSLCCGRSGARGGVARLMRPGGAVRGRTGRLASHARMRLTWL